MSWNLEPREVVDTVIVYFSVTEVDFDQPLPPPKAAANTLKASSLRAIQQWNDKFGEAYKKLSLGFNFLQKCKKVWVVIIYKCRSMVHVYSSINPFLFMKKKFIIS